MSFLLKCLYMLARRAHADAARPTPVAFSTVDTPAPVPAAQARAVATLWVLGVGYSTYCRGRVGAECSRDEAGGLPGFALACWRPRAQGPSGLKQVQFSLVFRVPAVSTAEAA